MSKPSKTQTVLELILASKLITRPTRVHLEALIAEGCLAWLEAVEQWDGQGQQPEVVQYVADVLEAVFNVTEKQ